MKINTQDWKELMETLSEEQKENIKAKCKWEHMSWLGVLGDWSGLFRNEKNGELIDKILLDN